MAKNPKIKALDWAELFFSSTGRLGQWPFLIACGLLFLALVLYQSAGRGPVHIFFAWLVYPILCYCSACVLSKRLHDRGRSGWWAAIILLAFVMTWPSPRGFFDIFALGILIWAGIDLSFMPGERGYNRYGKGTSLITPDA